MGRFATLTQPFFVAAAAALIVCGLLFWGFADRRAKLNRVYENQLGLCESVQQARAALHLTVASCAQIVRRP